MNHAKAPLDDAEIRQAAAIVRRDGGLDESAWFETVGLDVGDRAAVALEQR